MINSMNDCAKLNNGVKMPWLGLGVWEGTPGDGPHIESAVKAALAAGYRSIDTAALYGNEAGVGRAVKDSGVKREDIFITTKVWNTDQGYETTLKAFEESRRKLNLDYVDLYLVHWPVEGKSKDTWRAMEKIYEQGFARAIGVSNYYIPNLKELFAACKVLPAVNQVEYHPLRSQVELRLFCKEHGIQLEAWAPLMVGKVLNDPVVAELASAHGRTPAQIILRWDLQHEVVTIPKSIRAERIAENANIFDFELAAEDMAKIDGLNSSSTER